MGELGSGINAFKKGIRDGDRAAAVEFPARAPETRSEPGK